jgi:hypothetical protein
MKSTLNLTAHGMTFESSLKKKPKMYFCIPKIIDFFKIIDYITQHYFFRELNSTIFHRFSAANYDSVLSLFLACQDCEIVLNESSKTTENALVTPKRYNKIFPKRGFFGNKFSFQNWF